MKRASIWTVAVLASSSIGFAQDPQRVIINQKAGPGPVTVGAFAFGGAPGVPVQGQPYSATITNESVQTLADGNRIVQSTSGTVARDSQGRTRQDMSLPNIGNLSATNAPHLVVIQDPVAQTSYTLDLTDKTAQKMPMPPMGPVPPPGGQTPAPGGQAPQPGGNFFYVQTGRVAAAGQTPDLPPPMSPLPPMDGPKVLMRDAQGQATTEDLGSQTMEGVFVTGVRTTRTIPAGQIGNEKPISIVTEVWTSPDLKTVVYSKRSDPRMGEQTFRLTGITRSEPDASLFSVPADFKIVEGPKPIIYRTNP
jgi:hypothetical protein